MASFEDDNNIINTTGEESADLQKDAVIKKVEEKPIFEKIHDALQDWSNKDESDQKFDDTRP